MKRWLWMAASVPLVTGCTALQTVGINAPDTSASGLLNTASKVGSDTIKLNECDKLGEDHVSLIEERSLGQSLAVAAAIHMAEPRIQPTTVTDSQRLERYWSLPYAKKAPLNQMNAEVARVGAKLAALSSRPELAWTFAVVDEPGVNAFSTPGGYVLVSRGLLERIQTENELAGVLAHEIAHVDQRHAIDAYLKVKVQGCKQAATAEIASDATDSITSEMRGMYRTWIGQPAALLNFNEAANFDALGYFTQKLYASLQKPLPEEQEFEADRLGLDLLVKAGYAPDRYIALIGSLRPSSGGEDGFLARHPDPGERVEKLRDELKTLRDSPLADVAAVEKAGDVPLPSVISANAKGGTAVSDKP